jgi:spore maturation protein CgeB
MRILYVAMQHDYGDARRGPSFEETNFRSALEGMGHELVRFDFMERSARDGLGPMRRDLVAEAADAQPDVAFFCLFTDQIDTETIERMGREGRCPTVNWFADDHWRFDGFTRRFAPAFDLAVTTDEDSLPKYAELPDVRVHLSQWACNRYAYRRADTELRHDVTFVGQPHGDRAQTIKRLRAAGWNVECWGHGWPAGRLDHDAMVEVFSSSRINLNLSNSSETGTRARLRKLVRLPAQSRPPQIKGRNFEVPGSGGFLLTERLPHLERYFELEREIGVYDGVDGLTERIEYWMSHPEERAAVAEAGYRRVLAEHTYDHRFSAIFAELGLAPAPIS